MASSILRTSFLPLLYSQDPLSFPSSVNLATPELKVSLSLSEYIILTPKKRAVFKES